MLIFFEDYYPLSQLIPTILDWRVKPKVKLKEKFMEELLDFYSEAGMPVPYDIMVKAVEVYGFIIENNYPQEDIIDGE